MPWLMLIIAMTFYLYAFVLLVSLGVMSTELKHSFMIGDAALGVLAAIYFYAYSGMQIPLGMILDRFGARKLLTAASLFCAIGAILFGTTHLFALAILGRLLIGVGSAAAYVSCIYIAATWLPNNRFALLNGIVVAVGMLGAVIGQAPLAMLIAKTNWHIALWLLGACGIVLAILSWTIIRDKEHPKIKLSHKPSHLLTELKIIIKNKQLWLAAVYGGLMYTNIMILGTLWGVPFLAAKYHISVTAAGSMISVMLFGFILGAPAIGLMSDHLRRRNVFTISTCTASVIFLTLIIYPTANSIVLASILLFIFGFLSGGLELCFPIAREITPPKVIGTAIGYVNFVNMIGAAILMPIVGLILEILKTHATHLTTATIYEVAMTSMLVLQILAFILSLYIKETHAKLQYTDD